MSVAMKSEIPLKAAVSVSAVCRQLKMSRSQFYLHVDRGTFHAPLRLPSNQRPYYTASMVEDILRARESGIGCNKEYVLFYDRKPTSQESSGNKDHSSLIDGLKNLGLTGVTNQQVESAFAACYPKGSQGQESDVLRTIFRHLKRSGSA